MKSQIDNLVRGIKHDLTAPLPAMPELAACFQVLGMDGLSKAIAQRAVLTRWAQDINLSSETRNYAQQQLEALPAF